MRKWPEIYLKNMCRLPNVTGARGEREVCTSEETNGAWNTKGMIRPYLWLGFYSDLSSDIPLAIVLKRRYGSCKFKTHIEGRADKFFQDGK